MPRTKGAHTTCCTVGNARYKAWQTMRLFAKLGRTFALADLTATDPTLKIDNTKVYCRALLRHGYLGVVVAKDNGRRGGHALYRLQRDTGPLPPRLHQDGRMYDLNTHELLAPSRTSHRPSDLVDRPGVELTSQRDASVDGGSP